MTAQEYLKQIKKLDTLINNKIAERQQWLDIALSITPNMSGDRVQSSGSQQKMADAINHYVDIGREIDRAVDELHDKKQSIISVLEELPELEYDVLHKHYVQYMPLAEIAELRGRSESRMKVVHTNALRLLETLIKDESETK